MIEDQRRTELADGGSAESLRAGGGEQRLLIEVIAETRIDIAQHLIVFEEGCDAVVCRRHGIACVNCVAEIAGVAEIVARCHCRCVRGRERRKQRVRILEVDALRAQSGHGRGFVLVNHQGAQPIRHEQDQVVRPLGTNPAAYRTS